MNKLEIAFWIAVGVAAMFVGHFAYLVAQKGWGWGLAKIKAWWAKGKADVTADVAAAKSDIATLKTDVANLKNKVGL
jgi:hypothetical protein